MGSSAQVVFPHKLFLEHLEAPRDTLMLLVEPDLFFRHLPFHRQKLVLHRASMRAFQDRLHEAGYATAYVETSADAAGDDRLLETLTAHDVTTVTAYDVVDDWLDRDLRRTCERAGVGLEVVDTPAFLTTDAEVRELFAGCGTRACSTSTSTSGAALTC